MCSCRGWGPVTVPEQLAACVCPVSSNLSTLAGQTSQGVHGTQSRSRPRSDTVTRRGGTALLFPSSSCILLSFRLDCSSRWALSVRSLLVACFECQLQTSTTPGTRAAAGTRAIRGWRARQSLPKARCILAGTSGLKTYLRAGLCLSISISRLHGVRATKQLWRWETTEPAVSQRGAKQGTRELSSVVARRLTRTPCRRRNAKKKKIQLA